jgi:hypothetical protein
MSVAVSFSVTCENIGELTTHTEPIILHTGAVDTGNSDKDEAIFPDTCGRLMITEFLCVIVSDTV